MKFEKENIYEIAMSGRFSGFVAHCILFDLESVFANKLHNDHNCFNYRDHCFYLHSERAIHSLSHLSSRMTKPSRHFRNTVRFDCRQWTRLIAC